LEAASEAGLQGAQPFAEGPGGVPQNNIFFFYAFRRRRNA